MGDAIKPRFTATITRPDREPLNATCIGRVAWCVLALKEAGDKGCTPLHRPAPRWSDYVFRARGLGINVETIDESQAGPFAGSHARYVLRDQLVINPDSGNLRAFLASPEGRREFRYLGDLLSVDSPNKGLSDAEMVAEIERWAEQSRQNPAAERGAQ